MNEVRNLTASQQQVEDWINGHEEQGRFLNELGLVSDEELAAGIAKDEKIKLQIEANPELADKIVNEDPETAAEDLNALANS